MPRLAPIRIIARPLAPPLLLLFNQSADAALLQHVPCHACIGAAAVQVVIIAEHAAPMLREPHTVTPAPAPEARVARASAAIIAGVGGAIAVAVAIAIAVAVARIASLVRIVARIVVREYNLHCVSAGPTGPESLIDGQRADAIIRQRACERISGIVSIDGANGAVHAARLVVRHGHVGKGELLHWPRRVVGRRG